MQVLPLPDFSSNPPIRQAMGPRIKVSVTVRGVGMFMRLFEKSYKV